MEIADHVAERGRITALNPDNGEILWSIDAAGYPERVFWATPEATDSLVIATGIDAKSMLWNIRISCRVYRF